MRRVARGLGLAALVAIAALAVFLVPTLWGKPWTIEDFYLRVFAELVLERPQLLSRLRILEPWGLDWFADDLDDYSVEFTDRSARKREQPPRPAAQLRPSGAERGPAALDRRAGLLPGAAGGGRALPLPRLPREPDERGPERAAGLHAERPPDRIGARRRGLPRAALEVRRGVRPGDRGPRPPRIARGAAAALRAGARAGRHPAVPGAAAGAARAGDRLRASGSRSSPPSPSRSARACWLAPSRRWSAPSTRPTAGSKRSSRGCASARGRRTASGICPTAMLIMPGPCACTPRRIARRRRSTSAGSPRWRGSRPRCARS